MNNYFKCAIDNETFDSKEKLINHMVEKHMHSIEDDEFISFLEELKIQFPNFNVISINDFYEAKKIKFELYIDENPQPILKDSFTIHNEPNSQVKYFTNHLSDVSEILPILKSIYDNISFIKVLLGNIDDISEYRINSIDLGDLDLGINVAFEFVVRGEKHKYTFNFAEDKSSLVKFIDAICYKQIEGKVSVSREYSTNVIRVNGVKIEDLLTDEAEVKLTFN